MRAWSMQSLDLIGGTLIAILGCGNVILKLGWEGTESVVGTLQRRKSQHDEENETPQQTMPTKPASWTLIASLRLATFLYMFGWTLLH